MADIKKKYELEAALATEAQQISSGQLKDENPLDVSEEFRVFCEACRRGDLKVCQEMISAGGININARDKYDYTPLILASLCGHYEVARLLLEQGASAERDTFQGERCLYNALNDRIRNLLLSYDYAKSTSALQPLAAHISSLLTRTHPVTADLAITCPSPFSPTSNQTLFNVHKFLLAARSPYFNKMLGQDPGMQDWKMPAHMSPEALRIVLQYVYMGEIALPRGLGEEEERDLLDNIEAVTKELGTDDLFIALTETNRRMARQQREEEMERGREQLEDWFRANVLGNEMIVDEDKLEEVKWGRDNPVFADVLLRAINEEDDEELDSGPTEHGNDTTSAQSSIPIGPSDSRLPSPPNTISPSDTRPTTSHKIKSTLYPAHRALLLRSEYFLTMFSSSFREASTTTPHLPLLTLDCSPAVLRIILTFLYTERADFNLSTAIEVLFAADELFIEKLKQRAALIISSLGNGSTSAVEAENPRGVIDDGGDEAVDIYEILRAGWDTRVQRLEEFAARYIAYRLESYIDDPEFAELVVESAKRVKERQETDTIELIDDIRYYLSERFRLRFEDSGLDEMMNEDRSDSESESDTASEKGIDGEDENAVGRGDKKSREDRREDAFTKDMEKLALNGASMSAADIEAQIAAGAVRTLDGQLAGDEFAQDAINYQILLGKIDRLLENLDLNA